MAEETKTDEVQSEEITLDDLDLSVIQFEDRDLNEWEDFLTVKIPSLPCQALEISQAIVEISNKYQIAYNAYNKLFVLTSLAHKAYKDELSKSVAKKLAEYESKKVRAPGKDTVEALVVATSNKLHKLKERYDMTDIIKEFFENYKTKLEKTMAAAKDISYAVNASDRMYSKKGTEGDGLG